MLYRLIAGEISPYTLYMYILAKYHLGMVKENVSHIEYCVLCRGANREPGIR